MYQTQSDTIEDAELQPSASAVSAVLQNAKTTKKSRKPKKKKRSIEWIVETQSEGLYQILKFKMVVVSLFFFCVEFCVQ